MAGPLGRIVVQTVVPAALGFVADRVAKQIKKNMPTVEEDPARTKNPPLTGTGNQMLEQLGNRVKPPETNVVVEGVRRQINGRKALAEDVDFLVKTKEQIPVNLEHTFNEFKNDCSVMKGAFKVAQDPELITSEDCKRIVKAEAKQVSAEVVDSLKNFKFSEAAQKMVDGAKNTLNFGHAAATTTTDGINKLAEDIKKRTSHEVKVAGVNVVATTIAANAAGLIPVIGPAAKVAILVTGNGAAGNRLAKALDIVPPDNNSSAGIRTMKAILVEKAKPGAIEG